MPLWPVDRAVIPFGCFLAKRLFRKDGVVFAFLRGASAVAKKLDPLWSNLFSPSREGSEALYRVITQAPLFRDFNRREFRQVEGILHRRQLSTDEILFREGERGVGMYIILSGKVRIVQQTGDGSQQSLAFLSAGDFFGEQALLDDSPRTASAMVVEAGEVVGFFRPDLLNLIERNPRLGLKVILHLSQMISARLRYTNQLLKEAHRCSRKVELERHQVDGELANHRHEVGEDAEPQTDLLRAGQEIPS